MAKLYNMTGRTLVMYVGSVTEGFKEIARITPIEKYADIKSNCMLHDTLNAENIGLVIPITSNTISDIDGLPDEQENIYYIVEEGVYLHPKNKDRKDLLVPTEPVHDMHGQIAGYLTLGRLTK